MFDVSARAMRGTVAVCLAVACAAGMTNALAGDGPGKTAGPRESGAPAEPLVVHGAHATTFAYRPRDTSTPKPAVVYLNGMCGVTTNGCPHFREGSEPFGWLVCPPANSKCPGGGASWGGSAKDKSAIVDGALADVATAYPNLVDAHAPSILVGFSQGAWTAIDVAREKPGIYTGLLLIGANVSPRPSDLKAAGVTRMVLAAGSYDMAAAPMTKEATVLRAAGIDVRFMSLGTVGHTYVADRDHESVLTEALAWLERRDAEGAPPKT